MRTLHKLVLPLMLSLLVALLTSTQASAQPEVPKSPGADVAEFLKNAEDAVFYPEVLGEEGEALKGAAATKITTTGTHLRAGDTLDFASQQVKVIPDGSYVVSVPIAGPTVAHGSAVAVTLDSSFAPTGIIENQLHTISDNSGQVQSWVDGTSIYDQVVTAENDQGTGGTAERGINWGKLNSCLASLGIPAWIAAGLSNICAIACAFTAGAGCVICIAGVIGFSGGAVTACVQRAWE